MALVRDWIDDFLDRHRARFDPHDWPDPSSDDYVEFVKGWVTVFALNRVTEEEADNASCRLTAEPPRFRKNHLPAVLRCALDSRGNDAPTDREAAEAASRGCGLCFGSGLVTVWHPQPDPANFVPAAVSAHCTCAMGRWMRQHFARDKELLRRIPDLADVQVGRSAWLEERPEVYA